MSMRETGEVGVTDSKGTVSVTVRILDDPGAQAFKAKLDRNAPVVEVLDAGLIQAGKQLSPPPASPVDRLHPLEHERVEPAIEDLTLPLWSFVQGRDHTRDFGIELAPAIRVNSRWAIATAASMTPKEILALFNLDPAQFTLYPPGSDQLLPLDMPVAVQRGSAFEAQKDGKYGAP